MLNRAISLIRRNPYPLYWLLRRTKPVLHVDRYRLSFAFGYEETKRILTDHEAFSSDFSRATTPEKANRTTRISLIASDPPVHTKLRGLVTKAFTNRAVAQLEPRIDAITHDLLDEVAPTGRIDLVKNLAYPLPVIIIAEMLGVPPEDRAQFKIWSDQIVRRADQIFQTPDEAQQPARQDDPPTLVGGMGPYFREILAKRRIDPQDDLISGLLAAEIDGEKLTEWDVLDFCSLLLVAGNVTTTNLISNAILCFLEHPDALNAVRQDVSLLPNAIEEVLRYRSPVQFMFRVTKQDVELGRRMIPENQSVIAVIGSANRDEAHFDHPHQFDITRSPNRHIAFGNGVHYCLGAPLARLEAKVALTAILERLPNMARAGSGWLPPSEGVILHGVSSLPLTFDPQSRLVPV